MNLDTNAPLAPPAAVAPPAHAPVTEPERIYALDVLRGFALLGILPVNLISFAHVFAAYQVPHLAGGFTGLDFVVWFVIDLVFEQKMITTFSLLFGAGLYLQVTRNEERRGRVGAARGLYYRRVGWLLLFGLLHAYLLWFGDILTYYAILGMLVYLFRQRSPRFLIITGITLLVLGSLLWLAMGLALDSPEGARQMREMMVPSAEKMRQEEAMVRDSSFLELAERRAPVTLMFQAMMLPFFGLWRIGGLMLLGIAFVKLGVLSATRTPRFYQRCAVVGLGLGVPLTLFSQRAFYASEFDLRALFGLSAEADYYGSLLMALGYLGVVMLVVQRGWLRALQDRLAAVGRMALTNYLSQTLICTFIFHGWGLGQFGTWSRSQLVLLALGVWAFQLIVSPLWLRHFQFGPMEWLWRTLTYLRPQPFHKVSAGDPA
jgi:uncharacterized protein